MSDLGIVLVWLISGLITTIVSIYIAHRAGIDTDLGTLLILFGMSCAFGPLSVIVLIMILITHLIDFIKDKINWDRIIVQGKKTCFVQKEKQ